MYGLNRFISEWAVPVLRPRAWVRKNSLFVWRAPTRDAATFYFQRIPTGDVDLVEFFVIKNFAPTYWLDYQDFERPAGWLPSIQFGLIDQGSGRLKTIDGAPSPREIARDDWGFRASDRASVARCGNELVAQLGALAPQMETLASNRDQLLTSLNTPPHLREFYALLESVERGADVDASDLLRGRPSSDKFERWQRHKLQAGGPSQLVSEAGPAKFHLSRTSCFLICRDSGPNDKVAEETARTGDADESGSFGNGWTWLVWHDDATFYDASTILLDLVSATESPALMGRVVLDDFAEIAADSPHGGLWQACLARAAARVYSEDDGDDMYPAPEEAARRAAHWCDEAGLVYAPETLAALFAMDQPDPFASDLAADLIRAMGLGT